jgi:hypothetical protein
MPRQEIKVIEYECSRCEWKWIARKNGKNKLKPSFCPKCKTSMWDIERKNDMGSFHRRQTIDYAKWKGMIWDQDKCKWKKPTTETEKTKLDGIISGRVIV